MTCGKCKMYLLLQCQCVFGVLLMQTPDSELTKQTLKTSESCPSQQHVVSERNPPHDG